MKSGEDDLNQRPLGRKEENMNTVDSKTTRVTTPWARGNRTSGTITWTAKNSSTFLNGSRKARTVLGAVRAAIKYGNGELMGVGKITIMEDGEMIREYCAGMVPYGIPACKWTRTDI